MVTQPGRRASAGLAVISVVFIGLMTLKPLPGTTTLTGSCIFCGTLGGVDFALNILLFIPLGLSLRWYAGSWKTPIIAGAALTLLVESMQWRLIAGRDPSRGDLVANTLGAIVGAWLAVEGVRWLNCTRPQARRLASVFAVLTAGIMVASASLLLPAKTRYPQWVQWTPPRPNLDRFRGRLLAVQLNGASIHPTEILRPDRSLDSTTRGLSVRATVSGAVEPTRRQAIVVRIANELEEGFALSQWHTRLAFRSNLVAARLKLRPPVVGLDDAFSVTTSDAETPELMISAESNPRAMSVERETSGHRESVVLPRTIGLAWSLFMPREVALDATWWPINAAWLCVLMLPISFFTARSARESDALSRIIRWLPFAVVVGALVAAPAVAGLSGTRPGEWLGVAAGLLLGAALERWTSRHADLNAGATVGTIRT